MGIVAINPELEMIFIFDVVEKEEAESQASASCEALRRVVEKIENKTILPTSAIPALLISGEEDGIGSDELAERALSILAEQIKESEEECRIAGEELKLAVMKKDQSAEFYLRPMTDRDYGSFLHRWRKVHIDDSAALSELIGDVTRATLRGWDRFFLQSVKGAEPVAAEFNVMGLSTTPPCAAADVCKPDDATLALIPWRVKVLLTNWVMRENGLSGEDRGLSLRLSS